MLGGSSGAEGRPLTFRGPSAGNDGRLRRSLYFPVVKRILFLCLGWLIYVKSSCLISSVDPWLVAALGGDGYSREIYRVVEI